MEPFSDFKMQKRSLIKYWYLYALKFIKTYTTLMYVTITYLYISIYIFIWYCVDSVNWLS